MPFVTRAARTKKKKEEEENARACFHGRTKIFIVWKWAFVRVCKVALWLKWREVWNTERPSRCGGVLLYLKARIRPKTGVHNLAEIQYLVTWTRNGRSFDRSMMPTSSKSTTRSPPVFLESARAQDLSLLPPPPPHHTVPTLITTCASARCRRKTFFSSRW